MNSCPICLNNSTYIYCSLTCSNKDRLRKNELKYNEKPKLCKQCQNPVPYLKRWYNVFCSHSCSATFNNQQRVKKYEPAKPDRLMLRFLAGECKHRFSIRKILIKIHGNQCAICRISAIWQSHPLTLIVDHIDGNAGNNLPNNLRLLCPNCNSQTPTFSGRNKGRGRKARGLPR